MDLSYQEAKQKFIEYLILLILGDANQKTSLLHIQKEIFLLWNFDKEINSFFEFVKHYRGPYLDIINESVKHPFILYDCWEYIAPEKKDKLSGGFVNITEEGKEKYLAFIKDVKSSKNAHLLHIITAVNILNNLYIHLTEEELLLIIYDSFPEFTKKSNVFDTIQRKKEKLARRMFEADYIEENKFKELLGK